MIFAFWAIFVILDKKTGYNLKIYWSDSAAMSRGNVSLFVQKFELNVHVDICHVDLWPWGVKLMATLYSVKNIS